MVLSIGVLSVGVGMLGCFLTYYILSFNTFFDGYGTDVSCNEDYLILALLGFFLAVLGVFLLKNRLQNKENEKPILSFGLTAIGVISSVYALFMVIKSYVKGFSTTPVYWAWFFVSLLCVALFITSLAAKPKK